MTDTVWDGKSKVYSTWMEEFYDSPDEARKAFDSLGVNDRTLMMCNPVKPFLLDLSYFKDDDYETTDLLPLKPAIDRFNDTIKDIQLWVPDDTRTLII